MIVRCEYICVHVSACVCMCVFICVSGMTSHEGLQCRR